MEYSIHRLTTDVSRLFKPSHVHTLVATTYSKSHSMSEIFKVFAVRLRDDRWVVVFKTITLIHLLCREGNSERILGYLCGNIDILYQAFFKTHGTQPAKLIKTYSGYLEEKAGSFRVMKYDWVKLKDEAIIKFKAAKDEPRLCKEVEVLQKQIQAAIGCNWDVDSMSDIVILQGYRFLLGEIITLFLISNEAIVRVLSLFCQMNKTDATKALQLYKNSIIQTKKMQEIFETAKGALTLQVEIPEFKVAPISLAKTLEDYLNAPDFEEQRKNYREKRDGKSGLLEVTQGSASAAPVKEKPLIDFFSTVEDDLQSNNGGKKWNDEFLNQNNNLKQQIYAMNDNLNSGTTNPFQASMYQSQPTFQTSVNQNFSNFQSPAMQTQAPQQQYQNNPFASDQQRNNPFQQETAYNPFTTPNSGFNNGLQANYSNQANQPQSYSNQPQAYQPAQQINHAFNAAPQNVQYQQPQFGVQAQGQAFNVENVFGDSKESEFGNLGMYGGKRIDPFVNQSNFMKPQTTGSSYGGNNNPFTGMYSNTGSQVSAMGLAQGPGIPRSEFAVPNGYVMNNQSNAFNMPQQQQQQQFQNMDQRQSRLN